MNRLGFENGVLLVSIYNKKRIFLSKEPLLRLSQMVLNYSL